MDREFEGRDEEPVQLNASTSNVVVVDNVRRRLQRTEGSGVHCDVQDAVHGAGGLRSGRTVTRC